MNFPAQATVEQFDMPRTCRACVPYFSMARPRGVEGRADVPVLVAFESEWHASVVSASLSRGLSFSPPDLFVAPA